MAWTDPRTWVTDELVTAALMNTHLRDNLNALGPIQRLYKTADETVTSNATPQNDDHLSFSVAANEIWVIQMRLSYSNNNAANAALQIDFTIPTSAAGFYSWTARAQTNNEDLTWTTAVASIGATSTLDQPVRIDGTLINSTTPGTFQFQWAQSVSSGTSTVVRKGSSLLAWRVA